MSTAVKPGGFWKAKTLSWLNGSRANVATEAAASASKFIDSGEEIAARIRREGPWPTALRLTAPLNKPRSQA